MAAERPHLTETHASKHYNKHLHFTRRYLVRRVFSRKESVDPQQMWVFRCPGDTEKYQPKNVKRTDKCKGISVMVSVRNRACQGGFDPCQGPTRPTACVFSSQSEHVTTGSVRTYRQGGNWLLRRTNWLFCTGHFEILYGAANSNMPILQGYN